VAIWVRARFPVTPYLRPNFKRALIPVIAGPAATGMMMVGAGLLTEVVAKCIFGASPLADIEEYYHCITASVEDCATAIMNFIRALFGR